MKKKLLLALSVAVACALRVVLLSQMTQELVPFYSILNLVQDGYQAVLQDLLEFAVPFGLFGIVLPIAIKWFDRLYKICAAGLLLAAVLEAALMLITGKGFIVDAVLYGAIGTMVGFGLYVFVAFLFSKRELFKPFIGALPKLTRVASMLFVAVVYVFIAAIMMIDYGTGLGKLYMFKPEYPLPAGTEANITLPEESQAMVYTSIIGEQLQRARAIAKIFQINPVSESSTDAGLVLIENGRSITYSAAGEWQYYDQLKEIISGEFLDFDACEAAARQFFEEHDDLDITLGELLDAYDNFAQNTADGNLEELGVTEQPEPKMLSRSLYFATTVDGYTLRGTGEVRVTFVGNGEILKIEKYGPELKPMRKIKVISAQEALDKLLAGEGAHTIFAKAASAKLSSCELGYQLDETQGQLLPIWLFRGTAMLEDGTEKDFEAYIAASS